MTNYVVQIVKMHDTAVHTDKPMSGMHGCALCPRVSLESTLGRKSQQELKPNMKSVIGKAAWATASRTQCDLGLLLKLSFSSE